MENGCLSVEPAVVWLDLWAFEGRVGRAEDCGHGPEALERWTSALSFYAGDFLPEDSARWIPLPRQRIRAKYRRAAEWVGLALDRSGRCAEAAECYRKALDADPLAEPIYQHLMRCYDRLGRRAEALAVYQRCRQTFLTQLGIMPGAETQALYQQLLKTARPPADGDPDP